MKTRVRTPTPIEKSRPNGCAFTGSAQPSAEFDKMIRDEIALWGPVIKKADIKV